jgi:hypothetical protein
MSNVVHLDHILGYLFCFYKKHYRAGREWSETPRTAILLVHGLFADAFTLHQLATNLANNQEGESCKVMTVSYLLKSDNMDRVDVQCVRLLEAIKLLQETQLKGTRLILGGVDVGGLLVRRVAMKVDNVIGWFSLNAPHRGGMAPLPWFFSGRPIAKVTEPWNSEPWNSEPSIRDPCIENDLNEYANLPVLLVAVGHSLVPSWSALIHNGKNILRRGRFKTYIATCCQTCLALDSNGKGNDNYSVTNEYQHTDLFSWTREHGVAQLILDWLKDDVLKPAVKTDGLEGLKPTIKADGPECKA